MLGALLAPELAETVGTLEVESSLPDRVGAIEAEGAWECIELGILDDPGMGGALLAPELAIMVGNFEVESSLPDRVGTADAEGALLAPDLEGWRPGA